MKAKTRMTVKARNPGISLKLWSIPISAPLKSIFSMAKLFSRLSHTAQLIAEPTVIRRINSSGDFRAIFITC